MANVSVPLAKSPRGILDRAAKKVDGRLTWQGLGNAPIHVCLVLMVVYAAAIATFRIGRPELRQSITYFLR